MPYFFPLCKILRFTTCVLLFSRFIEKTWFTVPLKVFYINNIVNQRPICPKCNKNHCAINYHRNGITYYRSICDECGRKNKNLKPRKKLWSKSSYKKKATCDLCGFRSILQTQITVFHIDGNLENVSTSNLRSICLNCVEVVKKKEVNWKRGDLTVDY
jgi:hypothetical protein